MVHKVFPLRNGTELSDIEIILKPIIIDTAVCSGCGLCSEVCPYKALALRDGTATYIIEDCFLCGHCQAVCPDNAITIPLLSQSPGDVLYEKYGLEADKSCMATGPLVGLMSRRRSCRNFKKKNVHLDILKELVQMGTTAPSGTNCQPWNFIILPCREDLFTFGTVIGNYFKKLNRLAESWFLRSVSRLFMGGGLTRYYHNHYDSVKEALRDWDDTGADRLFHGAQAAILVTAKKDASCPAEDALLATGNILLVAHSMGLGTCLIGFAVEAVRRDKSIRETLILPEDEELYAVIAIGHPKLLYLRPAGRKKVVPRVFRFDKTQRN